MTRGPAQGADDVTVVIPTRDRPALVAASVASARAQDQPPAAVIVVDDGSREPLHPLPGATILRHATSLGVAAARNAGILSAQTRWVALLDDDDLWAPEKLRLQLEAAAQTDAAWVYGSALHVDRAGRSLLVHDAPPAATLSVSLREANVIPAGSSNVVVRRDVLLETGLFDPAFRHFADWDLWLRLAQVAPAAAVDVPVVAYVRHDHSMQVAEIESARAELDALARKHHRPGMHPLGGAWMDLWLAEGLMGAGHPGRALGVLARSGITRRSPVAIRAGAGGLARAIRRRAGRSPLAPPWARPAPFRPPVD